MKQNIYISNYDSKKIIILTLDNEGKLHEIQNIYTNGYVQPIIINKNKLILYAGVRSKNKIITYKIQKDGKLEEIEQTPLLITSNHLEIDYINNLLFVTSYNYNCIDIYKISKYGIPKKYKQTINKLHGCHSTNLYLKKNIFLIPTLKEDCIYIYELNKNKKLVHHKQIKIKTKKKSGPRHMTFHNKNEYAYCINELDSTINILNLKNKNKKKIKIIQTIDTMPYKYNKKRWGADIHITPNNKYLYTSDRALNIITSFKINKEGNKISITGHFKTETCPRAFNIDYYGKYLISVGQKSNSLTIYKILKKENGRLSYINCYNTGNNPMWIITNLIKK
ncbi:6-phosphogluconolactonase [Candidatus Purcelliella pentastirinorum]|nr:6-phosphogluconolactonase [Candidatus Purcelliella pentastirinorum]